MNNATLDNTLFVTNCDYPNPEAMCATLKRSADHFGVPLSFASWGGTYSCHFDKIPKLYSFFKKQSSAKYAFCVDCRDVVFAGTPENILATFNEVYTGGVLHQRCRGTVKNGLFSYVVAQKIAATFSNSGLACGGCFCGEISALISVFERCLELREKLRNRDISDPLVALYLSDPGSGQWYDRALANEEFFFNLLQAEEFSLIRVDKQKRLLAGFSHYNQFVPIHAYSLEWRRQCPPYDRRSVGTATILHSPALSKNAEAWKDYVDQEILTTK